MLAAAVRVEAIECAHALEAEVRELRLIAAHKPPYNRRSKFPERHHWLKLTVEPYPRLSVVRQLTGDGATYLGPFRSTRTAELAAAGLYDALPLRQCSARLSARTPSPACALAELGRCPAPCEHRISVGEYDLLAAQPFRNATVDDPGPLVTGLLERIAHFATTHRYEEAAVVRSRLGVLLRATIRMQRIQSLTVISELVAARPRGGSDRPSSDGRPPAGQGGWELAVIRHGRLVAAGVSPPRTHPRPVIEALLATAETVRPGPGPTPCASAEETERILAWLERDGTRLVQTTHGWALPAAGASRFRTLLTKVEHAATQPYVHQ